MAKFLTSMKIDLSNFDRLHTPGKNLALIEVGDSVFLKTEFAHSKHVSLKNFDDWTGYECFVNHIHMPCRRAKRPLLSALGYIANLKRALEMFRPNKNFTIIASFSCGECTVRFHQRRQNETWLADDLEGYKLEKILEIWTVGHPKYD
ncbi:MAG: hypothetical protein ABSC48_03200 [Terracidiphilus sp.]